MEDMAQDFGWSMDDFWEEEELTPEELEAERRSLAQQARDEMIGEMYNASASIRAGAPPVDKLDPAVENFLRRSRRVA